MLFREKIMRQCTAMEGRDLTGLPREELFALIREGLLQPFPQLLEDFETTWSSCVNAIGQACKRLHRLYRDYCMNVVLA